MVPNDSFNSVLCGGLKAIFTGLRQAGAHRQQVYKALEDLPYILNDHASRIRIYYSDEDLHRMNALLFMAVFELLTHIIVWFLRNPLLTGLKVVIDPSGFTEELNERLAQVKLAAARFERHAMTLALQMQRIALEQQTTAASTQDRMGEDLQTLLMKTVDMEERLARNAVLQSLDPLLLDQIVDAFERRLLTTAPAAKQLRSRSRFHSKQTQAAQEVSLHHILENFLYDRDLVMNDLDKLKNMLRSLRGAGNIDLDIDRLKALQVNDSLRAFLTLHESSLMLLNANAEMRPDSEVSVFMAVIVDRLLQQYHERRDAAAAEPFLAPAAFFCGRHRNVRKDVNAQPEEAAMSLLLQLLDRLGPHTSKEVLQQCYEIVDPGSMASICWALDVLITNAKADALIFIVMDGAKYFSDTPERAQRTRELVTGLVDIYRKQPAAIVKFMFSSATRADFILDLFESFELVTIARRPRATDGPARSTIDF